jgi:hypothetical protein
MRIPHDYSTGTEASVDTSTWTATFEISRVSGKLVGGAPPPMPVAGDEPRALTLALEHGAFVDRSQDGWFVTYSLKGDQLKVETEMLGHFGGTSVGMFKRVSP